MPRTSRPPSNWGLRPGERRDRNVPVLFSASELARLNGLAEARDCSRGSLIRELIRRGLEGFGG